MDHHVGNIYNALHLLSCQFLDNVHQKHESVEFLVTLRRLLVDLRTPFKERRSFLNLNFTQFSYTISCIEGFLSSLSLKWELENEGRACVYLAGNPVRTSLALPVAFDAIDEIIDNINSDNYIGKDVMQFPKANRLCSGSVLASGEELPGGIATSAFDGIRLSKWEEPNGAKGCWLLYKVLDNKMQDLEAYDLMSANDIPERDPMDWIVEGSDDGGINWYILDKQSSQLFEKRFLRKTFKVGTRRKSNAFRFHFLSVRDSEKQSRFQIGSINLYTKDR